MDAQWISSIYEEPQDIQAGQQEEQAVENSAELRIFSQRVRLSVLQTGSSPASPASRDGNIYSQHPRGIIAAYHRAKTDMKGLQTLELLVKT